MAKFESSIRQIDFPQAKVYAKLSNLENVEAMRDKLPEDKVKDLKFDRDSLTLTTPMGAVKLEIVEREEPKCIKFAASESPLPFNFWIQLLPVTDSSCKMKLTIKAELNMLLLGMVKGPLKEALEKIADVLQMIDYD